MFICAVVCNFYFEFGCSCWFFLFKLTATKLFVGETSEFRQKLINVLCRFYELLRYCVLNSQSGRHIFIFLLTLICLKSYGPFSHVIVECIFGQHCVQSGSRRKLRSSAKVQQTQVFCGGMYYVSDTNFLTYQEIRLITNNDTSFFYIIIIARLEIKFCMCLISKLVYSG